MTRPAHDCPLTFSRRPSTGMLRLYWVSMLLLAIGLLTLPAQAQTFTVLHTFTGPDGLTPYAGVTLDGAGNLYGTTFAGGTNGLGTVYELRRHGSSYILNELHAFAGGASDGAVPFGGVIFGPEGLLYGTTYNGGYEDSGVVYSLQPLATICPTVSCPWTETTLYNFATYYNSFGALYGELAFDPSGNLDGTLAYGGRASCGSVYQVSRSGADWTGTTLYSFPSTYNPTHNVIADPAGNLYGTTDQGGQYDAGVVFELTPNGSGWTEQTIASLGAPGTGGDPLGGLIRDSTGNLYGGETGFNGNASVFELSPSGGGWQLTVLYTWSFSNNAEGPVGNLVLDSSGNLYGTTMSLGAHSYGNIFKLTRDGGGWTYTDLYDFQDNGDGAYPSGDLSIDGDGNIYGTNQGDQSGHGVVWKLTP
jgi:uncharacterized repeat protein (TIGR03803 family)